MIKKIKRQLFVLIAVLSLFVAATSIPAYATETFTQTIAYNKSQSNYWEQYCSNYLYSQLNTEEKRIYDLIYIAGMGYLTSPYDAVQVLSSKADNQYYVPISLIAEKQINPASVERAWQSILSSCPVFFFFDGAKDYIVKNGNSYKTYLCINVRPEYANGTHRLDVAQKIKNELEFLYNKAENFSLTHDITEMEEFVGSYIGYHYGYDGTDKYIDQGGRAYHQFMDGPALFKEGVCMSYSEYTAALLNRIGLESLVIINLGHAWVHTLYGHGWTMVDPTGAGAGTMKNEDEIAKQIGFIVDDGTLFCADGVSDGTDMGLYKVASNEPIFQESYIKELISAYASSNGLDGSNIGYQPVLGNPAVNIKARPNLIKSIPSAQLRTISDILPLDTYNPTMAGVNTTAKTKQTTPNRQASYMGYVNINGDDNGNKPNGEIKPNENNDKPSGDNTKPDDGQTAPDNNPDDKPSDKTPSTENKPVYRLFNRKSGDRLLTTDAYEVQVITSKPGSAWNYEGEVFVSGTKESGTPVYRVFNPRTGEHLYTKDAFEVKVLTTQRNWNDEGIAYYVSMIGEKPVMRLFNPKGGPGSHLYTADVTEFQTLLRKGWKDEGIAWFQ